MSTLLVFPQITLADVLASARTYRLDVDAFTRAASGALAERTGKPEADLVGCLFLADEHLARQGVDEAWRAMAEKVKAGAVLSHPASPGWSRLEAEARKLPGWRTARVIRPLGVRTLAMRLEKPSWDFRAMPSETLGAEAGAGGFAELCAAVWELIAPTTGGREFLEPAPKERALAVVATTVAAVLSEDAAQKSDHRRGAKLVRADVYERAIEGMGLGRYVQALRRVLELDHPEHVAMQAAWPNPGDPVRELGILEYRGRREPYLALNAPAIGKAR